MLFLKDKNKSVSLIIFKVYVAFDKKYFTYSTGTSIKTSEWDFETNQPLQKRGEPGKENARTKARLDEYNIFYQSILNDPNIEITKEVLKNKFDEKFKNKTIKKGIKSFTDYPSDLFEDFITEKENVSDVEPSTIEKYRISYNVFIQFENATKKYTFDEINDDLFSDYLIFVRKEKDYLDTTMHRHFKFLKTFWNWAYKKAKKTKLYDSFTFKNREVDKISLTENELETLFNLKLNGRRAEIRDLFLIGCYSGQRFSDYSLFEKSDIRDGMIVKYSQKTEVQAYIPLHTKLKMLLEKYNYKPPISKHSQNFNQVIQSICNEAKINEKVKIIEFRGSKKTVKEYEKWELIGSHTARRSFITISSSKGMPDHIIMDIVGIKDVKTLHRYKRVNTNDLKEATIKVWE